MLCALLCSGSPMIGGDKMAETRPKEAKKQESAGQRIQTALSSASSFHLRGATHSPTQVAKFPKREPSAATFKSTIIALEKP